VTGGHLAASGAPACAWRCGGTQQCCRGTRFATGYPFRYQMAHLFPSADPPPVFQLRDRAPVSLQLTLHRHFNYQVGHLFPFSLSLHRHFNENWWQLDDLVAAGVALQHQPQRGRPFVSRLRDAEKWVSAERDGAAGEVGQLGSERALRQPSPLN
jgi:hypothetical protein